MWIQAAWNPNDAQVQMNSTADSLSLSGIGLAALGVGHVTEVVLGVVVGIISGGGDV